jgi:alkanesulfonate monooxygenase SsuD/methylene tetrahydromethanopterin reductase-like flavin-dependent oxidoreductase (luciferase family)
MLGVVIGRDEQEIARRLDRLSNSPIVTDAQGSDGLAATLLRLQRKGWLIGSPTQIVETLGHLSDAGVSRVMLHHLDKHDFDALELIAAEVLPQAQT